MSTISAISNSLLKKTVPLYQSTFKAPLTMQTLRINQQLKYDSNLTSISAEMRGNNNYQYGLGPLQQAAVPPEMPQTPNVPDFDPIPPEKPAEKPPISPPSPGPDFPGPPIPLPPDHDPPGPDMPGMPIPEIIPPHGPDVIPPKPPEPGPPPPDIPSPIMFGPLII